MDTPTLAALRAASAGLSFQSDTDAPWRAFAWPDAVGPATADGVRARGHHPKGAKVTAQAVDAFFAPLVADQDWYGAGEKAAAAKYRAVLAAVQSCLTGAAVFRVGGRTATVYVVGTAREGGWAGLTAAAVDT